MPAYSYQALDTAGKTRKGRVEAADRQAAVLDLKMQGLFITQIDEAQTSIWKREIELGPKRLPLKDFVPFLRQFATLVKAGVTLVESLRVLSEQTSNKKLKKILSECASHVARGHQLSEALREHDQAFPSVFSNMVRAGEITGNMEDVLDRLASMLEKEHNTREKVKSALTYPSVIGVVAVLVSVFLLVNVIPNFVKNLHALGGELPLSTRIVMGTSTHLIHWWYWYLLGICALVLGLRAAVKTPKGRFAFDLFKLNMPVFGVLFQKAAIARSSRTMATLLQSAVPALTVFTVAANVVGNEVYANALRQSREALRAGQSMVTPLREEKMFPPLVTQMIAIGEQTGSVDAMLSKIADFYEADVETTVDKLRPMIEPIMVLLLAIVVGVIVTAAIAPMFEIYKSTGRPH
ncbi:type II secretion system F family protein [Tumebacillus permanentifrigoris]|uniref:Type IV pilus assembly protein PilC n=1 Tax=Tumebacillus permanentifrigoris TaxID=378543 RepID=A0A316D5H1_9BACL|nr:type II secretion system F family protein [Tumebacillus permanentifrigoris]PWK06249.1 type IV pilus assembly protein PilC [Tumebacillus permanentifrigoris]